MASTQNVNRYILDTLWKPYIYIYTHTTNPQTEKLPKTRFPRGGSTFWTPKNCLVEISFQVHLRPGGGGPLHSLHFTLRPLSNFDVL